MMCVPGFTQVILGIRKGWESGTITVLNLDPFSSIHVHCLNRFIDL